MTPRSTILQITGSLLVAALIVVIVVVVVTAAIGPGLDAKELRERQELLEERRELELELREERQKQLEDGDQSRGGDGVHSGVMWKTVTAA